MGSSSEEGEGSDPSVMVKSELVMTLDELSSTGTGRSDPRGSDPLPWGLDPPPTVLSAVPVM